MKISKPSKWLAYLSVITGGILFLSGIAALLGYLGLPMLVADETLLASQLGQIAAITLGLVGGGLGVFHGLGSILERRSSSFKLPPYYLFLLVFALVLGLGNLLITLLPVPAGICSGFGVGQPADQRAGCRCLPIPHNLRPGSGAADNSYPGLGF